MRIKRIIQIKDRIQIRFGSFRSEIDWSRIHQSSASGHRTLSAMDSTIPEKSKYWITFEVRAGPSVAVQLGPGYFSEMLEVRKFLWLPTKIPQMMAFGKHKWLK